MIPYIKLSTLEYYRHEGDIRLEHPEIPEDATYPNFPCPPTYAPVTILECPEYNPETQRVELLPPQCIDGVWTAGWGEVYTYTDDELAQIKTNLDAQSARLGIRPPSDLTASGAPPDVLG